MFAKNTTVTEVCEEEAVHFMVERKPRERQEEARDKVPLRTRPQ
jgi:hypothetical protein